MVYNFNMRFYLIVPILLLSSCALPEKISREISSNDNNFRLPFKVNLQKMSEFLMQIKPIEELPVFERSILIQEFEPDWKNKCKEVSGTEELNIFNDIVKLVFNHIKIPFYICSWAYENGTLLNNGIFLSESYSRELNEPKKLADYLFTLAHEISHYVHEISTQLPYSKSNGYSINNYPSYRLSDYDQCKKLERQDRQWECEMDLWEKGHSEVDIYAVLILKKYGFKDWKKVKESLFEKIDNNKSLSGEDRVRSKLRINQRFEIINQYL